MRGVSAMPFVPHSLARSRSQAGLAIRQYFQGTSVPSYVAFGALALMFFVAIFAKVIAPYDPLVPAGQPMTGPYVICFNNGCMADYEASGELIGKLKAGKGLVVQGINGSGQPISLVLPLGDFGKAYDGPPTDPKVFEEQQKKLQDELQARAEKARRELEAKQAAPAQR